MRRLQWYQRRARHPKDHLAVVTAVLGTCTAEEMVGVWRLTSEGNVCQTHTQMARQMAIDFAKVAQMREAVETWCSQRRDDVARKGAWKSKVSGVFCGSDDRRYVGVPIHH